jgi:hypothetical protein
VHIPLPERSTAVLIGAGVRDNLSALADTLRDPGIWGLPAERCVVVPDTARADAALVAAAASGTDTLFVYYAGPLVAPDPIGDRLRDCLAAGRARRRILIIDALGHGAAQAADRIAVDGCYALIAATDREEDFAPAGERFTTFTAELLYVLRNGLADAGEHLDLDEIYAAVRQHLRDVDRPIPRKRARSAVGTPHLVRNRAFDPAKRDGASQARRLARAASEAFLRVHGLPHHDELYVSRQIDREVEAAARALAPARLRERYRE